MKTGLKFCRGLATKFPLGSLPVIDGGFSIINPKEVFYESPIPIILYFCVHCINGIVAVLCFACPGIAD
jgi:hypothetical protein